MRSFTVAQCVSISKPFSIAQSITDAFAQSSSIYGAVVVDIAAYAISYSIAQSSAVSISVDPI